jgi:sec-independent protein translocase protein TatC
MSFMEHLHELRGRLFKCVLAIGAGSVGGWFLAQRIEKLLDDPVCAAFTKGNCRLVILTVYGGFTLQIKIAIIVGFGFALPVTIFQIWKFVSPAFGGAANWWAPVWMFSAFSLFSGGVVTGYFVIPLALRFFANFQNPQTYTLVSANEYLSFIILILLVFGISFELPLVLVSLTAAGLTSSQWLASKRVYFFFGIFVFATIATPGADWISPLVLGGILYVFYELSILFGRFILRK